MVLLLSTLVLWASCISPALCRVTGGPIRQRADTPQLPYDPNTSKYCTYWYDYTDSRVSCEQVPQDWGITKAEFIRWVILLFSTVFPPPL